MNSDRITCDEIRRCITDAEYDVLQVVEYMSSVKANLAEVKKYVPNNSYRPLRFDARVAHAVQEIADLAKTASEVLARFQLANAALSETILPLATGKSYEDMVEEFEAKKNISNCDDTDQREQREKRIDWDMENKEKVWLHKKDENLMREWLRSRCALPQEFRDSENKYWLVSRETKTCGNPSWKTEELRRWLKKMVLPEEPRNPLQIQNMNAMDFQCCDDASSVSESITVARSESPSSSEFSVICSPNDRRDTTKWLIPKHNSQDKSESFGCNARSTISMDIEDLDNRSFLLSRQCANRVGNVTDEDRDGWLVKRDGPNASVYSVADSCVANETCTDFSACLCDENCLKMAMLNKMRPVRNKNRTQPDELAAFRPYGVVSPIIDTLHSSSKHYLKRKTQNGEQKS